MTSPTNIQRTLMAAAMAGLASACATAHAPAASTQQPTAVSAVPAKRAATGPHKHMLFAARGPGGATVYLLGSVHLLTADAGVLPPEIDSAFAHAKTIAFEASLDTIQLRATELLAHSRYASGGIAASFTPVEAQRTDSILHLYGLSLPQVDQFKPWFVSLMLTQLAMQRAKYQAQYGVDMQLNTRAHAANKPIIGLESVDVQLNLFDALSPEDQRRMLLENRGPDSSIVELNRIKDAWLAGDTATLNASLNKASASSPAMFDILVVNRNKSWMPKIEQLLAGRDDALVVVGAAHLVGKQGVIEMLRAKGYTIRQL